MGKETPKMRNTMRNGQGDSKDAQRCASLSSTLVYICGLLACLSLRLLATRQGACTVQKRRAKDALKIALHLSNPRGSKWTARHQFSAPFAVVKQYHIAGNTVVNSCLKIQNNDDRDFSPKMTFIRKLKILREFGMCSKSFGTN